MGRLSLGCCRLGHRHRILLQHKYGLVECFIKCLQGARAVVGANGMTTGEVCGLAVPLIAADCD